MSCLRISVPQNSLQESFQSLIAHRIRKRRQSAQTHINIAGSESKKICPPGLSLERLALRRESGHLVQIFLEPFPHRNPLREEEVCLLTHRTDV